MKNVAHLTRRYWFAASHRLHSNVLAEDENQRLYGKCNNPYGHGHNYALEVTVGGPVDPATGMVLNLVDLDRAVTQEVIERFDHVNLNCCGDFNERVPTTENLCIRIYDLLAARWTADPAVAGTRLEKIRLEETRNNTFEYVPDPAR